MNSNLAHGSKRTGFLRSDDAQAIAEIALSIPVLMMFFSLVIQSVLIVNGAMMTYYAAFQAARVGMLLEMSYNVSDTVPEREKGEISLAEFYNLVEKPVMARVATICLTPLRYRTTDPAKLATGIGRAYIDDFLFMFQQTPRFPNLSGDYFKSVLSQIWQVDTYLDIVKDSIKKLINSVIGGSQGDMNGTAGFGDGIKKCLKQCIDKLIKTLKGDLLNTFESALMAFNPLAGMKSRICEVERMIDLDSDTPMVALRLDNRKVAVKVTHHFRLDIPFASKLVYLLYNLQPSEFRLAKIWNSVAPTGNDLTIDLTARYCMAVPKVTDYEGSNTTYITDDDVKPSTWISGKPTHYNTLTIK